MFELEKNKIRKELNYLRNSQSKENQDIANLAISEKLRELEEIIYADTIAAYMPMKNEVDLSAFFQKCLGKRLCFPRYKREKRGDLSQYEMALVSGAAFKNQEEAINCFTEGKFGIPEPLETAEGIPPDKIDVWLIPGVGFDKDGNRIGRGGGFYDRLLKNVSGIKIGIGYDLQLIEKVPHGSNDQQMDMFVGNSIVLNFCKNK